MAITRKIDSPLNQTINRLRAIARRTDEAVIEALIKLKSPSFGAGVDPAVREHEVNRLKWELQDEAAYTFARFPPVADDLRLLVMVMNVAGDLAHIVRHARRTWDKAGEIGRSSVNLQRLAALVQRQSSECFAAVIFHFDDMRDGSREKVDIERLEAIVAARREAESLFRRVVTEPPPGQPSQLEFEGAVADELESISDLAAKVAEALIAHRCARR